MTAPFSLVDRVQRAVNAGVRYQSDDEQFGMPELWREARIGGAGDCEDIALAKRRALLTAGVDLAALRLAICRVETGEMHLVLVVTTDRGDLVLDNRHADPMARQDLPYTWFMLEECGRWTTVA